MYQRKDQIHQRLIEEGFAISYERRSSRILLRLHTESCLQHRSPPRQILNSVQKKLRQLEREGLIEFSYVHERKLKRLWDLIRKGDYRPADNLVRMTVAHCGRDTAEISVEPCQDHHAIAKLRFHSTDKIDSLSFPLFRSIVYHKLAQIKIHTVLSDAVLRYIHLRLRHHATEDSFFLFSSFPQEKGSSRLLQKHFYYGFYYVCINELENREEVLKQAKFEMNQFLIDNRGTSYGRNLDIDFRRLRKQLYNKAAAFGYNRPIEFLFVFPSLRAQLGRDFQEGRPGSVERSKSESHFTNQKQRDRPLPFELQIYLSPDEMLASIVKVRDVQSIQSEAQIRAYLQSRGVVHGYEDFLANVMTRIKEGVLNDPLIIARGTAPVNGEKKVLWNLSERSSQSGRLQGVRAGEAIAELRFEDGQAGQSVTGHKIPPRAPWKDFPLELGPGVKRHADGRIYSTQAGYVVIDGARISCIDTEIHEGDYSPRLGALRSYGNLRITGHIERGAAIHIDGDLHVEGSIFSSNVRVGGNLTADGGIIGDPQHVLQVGRNLNCQYIDQARITCLGDIRVENYVLRSQLFSQGNVTCQEGVANSEIYAVQSVSTQQLGDELNHPCLVVVGIEYRSLQRLQRCQVRQTQLQKALESHEKQLAALQQENLRILEKSQKTPKIYSGFYGKSTAQEEYDTSFWIGRIEKIKRILQKIQQKYEKLLAKVVHRKDAKVTIEDKLFRNVTIKNGKTYLEKQDFRTAVFFSDADGKGDQPQALV